MDRFPYDAELLQRVRDHLAGFERLAIVDDTLVRAAVAVTVVGGGDGEASFILTRRPLTLKRHAGQWALPGGRADAGESAGDAALRELEEEVGLTLASEDILGRLDDFRTRSGFVITPVVVWGPARPELDPDPNEVHAAHVVPLAALDAPGVPTIQEGSRPLISFPIPVLGTTVWAPTAAMLYQTREVLLHGRPTRVAHFEQPRWAWK